MEKVSELLRREVIDSAVKEMKDVIEGRTAMSSVGMCAFKVVGDYFKIVAVENQKEMLAITREKYQDSKMLTTGGK